MSKALAAWLLITAAAASTQVSPREVVQATVERVLRTLEEAQAPPAAGPRADPGRVRAEIRRLAAALFDFEEVARRALGRHWGARTPEERAEFLALFTDLLERAYVGRLESYAGERVVFTGETVDGEYAVVRSRLITRRRVEMALDYRLHRAEGQWKVYDVVIDGVSFVSTYRRELNHLLQLTSWDDLMDRLRKRRVEARTVLDR
jgi:phospholipid transport system substrate-binding protein